MKLCREVIEPFYKQRSRQTQEWITQFFDDSLDYHGHVCEGAFFLWLWFRDLPDQRDRELYERLKARKVLVVPGSYCFAGLEEEWRHKRECIRITYCAEAGIACVARHRNHRRRKSGAPTGNSESRNDSTHGEAVGRGLH